MSELDDRVAREVMEGEDGKLPANVWGGAGFTEGYVDVWCWPDNGTTPKADWHPSNSWADAGRVIERMHELGWELTLRFWGRLAEVHYESFDGTIEGNSISREPPWVPEAISRAALEAMNGQ